MGVRPDGRVVLGDSGNQRLLFLAPEGILEAERPHTSFPELVVSTQAGRRMVRHVARPVYSAVDLDVWHDTLYVLAGGNSQYRHRIIDKYDIGTGAYLESLTLPTVADHIAVRGETVFTIDRSSMFPRITSSWASVRPFANLRQT